MVNEYQAKETIYHLDLYRLKNLAEAYDMGIEDYIYSPHYCFIEWPQIIEGLLDGAVFVHIDVKDDNSRLITIKK